MVAQDFEYFRIVVASHREALASFRGSRGCPSCCWSLDDRCCWFDVQVIHVRLYIHREQGNPKGSIVLDLSSGEYDLPEAYLRTGRTKALFQSHSSKIPAFVKTKTENHLTKA